MRRERSATVFSTDGRSHCRGCGRPVIACDCSTGSDQPVPARPVARLRVERAGRRGKTVTVVEGLPRNRPWLRELASELRRACGSGGTHREDRIEIQGDHRDVIRAALEAKGWRVKG